MKDVEIVEQLARWEHKREVLARHDELVLWRQSSLSTTPGADACPL